MILSMLLTELGFNVETAEDGEQGIQLFKRDGDFDLIITDIRMPKMDGNEVARYIRRSRRPTIPVIAITGFPEEAEMGLFDYALVKPFKLEMLRSICARFKAHDRPAAPALGDGG